MRRIRDPAKPAAPNNWWAEGVITLVCVIALYLACTGVLKKWFAAVIGPARAHGISQVPPDVPMMDDPPIELKTTREQWEAMFEPSVRYSEYRNNNSYALDIIVREQKAHWMARWDRANTGTSQRPN